MSQIFEKETVVTEQFAVDPLSWRYQTQNRKQFIATYFKEREIDGTVRLQVEEGEIQVPYDVN